MQQLTRPLRVAALLALSAPCAHAHGGLFRSDQIRLDPLDPAHLLVRSDVWGLVESRDGGASWRWVCAEAFGGNSIALERNPFAVLPGGAVLAGAGFSGLFRSPGSLCEAGAVPFFQDPWRCGSRDCLPVDIALESRTLPIALVLTAGQRAGGGYASLLFRTPDGGATWATLPDSLPTDLFASGLGVAPSDARTLYVAATTVALPQAFLLLRSRDGGATWSSASVPLSVGPGEPPVTLRVHGVSPKDPETVFLWGDASGGDPSVKAPDRLLVSTDGGASSRLAFAGTDDLPGFAISPDGATVFVGGVADGLLSAPVAALAGSDAGTAFRRVDEGPTWALAFTPGGLLAGRQDFGGPEIERMSLGLLGDGKAKFEPALVICDVAPMACPAGSRGATECAGLFHGPSNFQVDQQGRRCELGDAVTGGRGGDASAGERAGASARHPGCGCRAAPGDQEAGLWCLAAGVAGAAVAMRRPRSAVRARPAPPQPLSRM